jgi:formamidopyrimidine-DNA glycosylase
MPELPEVETTRRGIEPHVVGRTIRHIDVRDTRLRWPVPAQELAAGLPGSTVMVIRRRAKYLLLETTSGCMILHLGMSGSLRVLPSNEEALKHEHVQIDFDDGNSLRLRDPRRFGALLWTTQDPTLHPLLVELGPEPLGPNFTAEYLFRRSRGRRLAIKNLVMDASVVVGVGNIYASEALFHAGIRPGRAAGRLSRAECTRLVTAIRQVLASAIEAGGTTLRDFSNSDGQPGYFRMSLAVYGRAGEGCCQCGSVIRQRRIGQRSSFYCPACQR